VSSIGPKLVRLRLDYAPGVGSAGGIGEGLALQYRTKSPAADIAPRWLAVSIVRHHVELGGSP
jgi:hypothetical protein